MSESRYRFIVRELEYPSEAFVWEVRDTEKQKTLCVSENYEEKEECVKDLEMLVNSPVILKNYKEKEFMLN